jgi:DDE family transposase
MILTTIFYHADNFCKDFEEILKIKSIGKNGSRAGRKPQMKMSEIMTITIYFHHSRMRTFKDYYNVMIKGILKKAFPAAVSYNRFVELMQTIAMPIYLFLHCCCKGKVTGIAFVDSMPLVVSHNLRISGHKVFKGYARRGKTSTGWFFGFKLHLVINEYGEIISFTITSGNVDDRNPKIMEILTQALWGKLFGDRGYISASLTKRLQMKGIYLFTRVKKNMKNMLMKLEDRLLLNKRGIIESVNQKLQSTCQVEHSRHRSVLNFFSNVLSGLAAYFFLDKKPSIVKFSETRLAAEC